MKESTYNLWDIEWVKVITGFQPLTAKMALIAEISRLGRIAD